MWTLIKLLRGSATRDAEEGEYHPQEHIDWMAADALEKAARDIAELEKKLADIAKYIDTSWIDGA